MNNEKAYPIGTSGKKWGEQEKAAWFDSQVIRRSYADEVMSRLEVLKNRFDIEQYGELCMGVSQAAYVTTTEVYPDSPHTDDETCIRAQAAAVSGALDYIIQTKSQVHF